MASQYRRFSVNTSMRDAKIFVEDSSSADDSILNIKEELIDDYDTSDQLQAYCSDNAISISFGSKDESRTFATSFLKEEFSSISTDSPIKQERLDFEMKLKFETDESINEAVCPPPPIISEANSSEEVKPELTCPPAPIISAKRNLLKRRNESYHKNVSESESDSGVSPVKRRHFELSPKKGSGKDNRTRRIPESDPEVLRRRQKQIDYGKNTIGYERYLTLIPRNKRGSTDPQTPDKFRKYSRRGWDGLIKQWRLKLHRFDPDDEEDNDNKEKEVGEIN